MVTIIIPIKKEIFMKKTIMVCTLVSMFSSVSASLPNFVYEDSKKLNDLRNEVATLTAVVARLSEKVEQLESKQEEGQAPVVITSSRQSHQARK
jgi:hypothetical protein